MKNAKKQYILAFLRFENGQGIDEQWISEARVYLRETPHNER